MGPNRRGVLFLGLWEVGSIRGFLHQPRALRGSFEDPRGPLKGPLGSDLEDSVQILG